MSRDFDPIQTSITLESLQGALEDRKRQQRWIYAKAVGAAVIFGSSLIYGTTVESAEPGHESSFDSARLIASVSGLVLSGVYGLRQVEKLRDNGTDIGTVRSNIRIYKVNQLD